MNRVFLCALITSAVFLQVVCEAAPRKPLRLSDIAGLYRTSDSRTPYKTLRLRLLRSYEHDSFEQGDFSGVMGSQPLVGQGVIPGDEGGLDDFVLFDFLYLNPQDETSFVHAKSIMRNGRVVGLRVQENGTTYTFRRVGAK